jgi:hypothetical protein
MNAEQVDKGGESHPPRRKYERKIVCSMNGSVNARTGMKGNQIKM